VTDILTNDEISLLRSLEKKSRTITGNFTHKRYDRLETKGYIKRSSQPPSMQDILYEITDAGKAALRAVGGALAGSPATPPSPRPEKRFIACRFPPPVFASCAASFCLLVRADNGSNSRRTTAMATDSYTAGRNGRHPRFTGTCGVSPVGLC
jgi:hypothetical protein